MSFIDYAFLWPVWLDKFCALGDFSSLLDETLPSLDLLLEFFEKMEEGELGLISDIENKYGLKCLIDYCHIDKKNVSTAVNSLYCRSLLSASDTYNRAGLEQKAAKCRKKAANLAKNLKKLAWNPEKCLFSDTVSANGASDACSMQTNVLAIFGGIADSDDYGKIFSSLCSEKAPFFKSKTRVTPYFSYFILETFFALGYTEWAATFMKHYWGKIVDNDPDCLWSFFPEPERTEPETDLCHGFSASPNIFIVTELAGIRPADLNFKRIYLNPSFSILKSARISLHTSSGRINVSWETSEAGNIEIQLDAGFPLEVIPTIGRAVLDKCTIAVGSSISVLEAL